MITPFYDKIVIEPFVEETIIQAAGGSGFKYAGKVLAIGEDVKFVKVGDTVFFAPHARWETSKVDGVKYHVLSCDSEFILGKIEHVEGIPVQS